MNTDKNGKTQNTVFDETDWRIMGQEGYLMNAFLQHRIFDRSICIEEYDDCDFCHDWFDAEDEAHPKKAYYCPDKHIWVCETCFNDFKDHFGWTVEELDEDMPQDALSRMLQSFQTIVDTDPRAIVVCDCQHTVRYLNEAARKLLHGDALIDRWCILAFVGKEEAAKLIEAMESFPRDPDAYNAFGYLYKWPVWLEMEKSFKYLWRNPDGIKKVRAEVDGRVIDMTALQNRRGEMNGYYLVLN